LLRQGASAVNDRDSKRSKQIKNLPDRIFSLNVCID